MSLWKTIAKKEIRIRTNRVRKNRKLFFVVIYSLALFWALYLGPNLFDIILPDLLITFSSLYKPFIILLIEYTSMMGFLLSAMYPLYILYKKAEIGSNEALLASPATSGDIFIGEFIAILPFYFLIVLAVGPLGTSLLMQINPKMNVIHFLVFYACVFAILVFGYLIGVISANWIEHKMAKSTKAKEKGKLLLVLITILVIAIFYFFHYVFEFTLDYPEFKIWFIFFPSSWYTNIIIFLIDPSSFELYFLFLFINILLAIIVPLSIVYISYKKADVFYDLNIQIEKEPSRTISQEKEFYNIIRKITPKKWEELVITQFKTFLRKKENMNQLLYSVGLVVALGVILSISLKDIYDIDEFSISFSGVYIKLLAVMIISWMGSLLYGSLIGLYAFLDTKELLFLYKKSPRGVNALIFSFLLEMCYLIIFIAFILTIVFIFLFQLDILLSLLFFFVYIISCEIILTQAVGIQCFKPLFEERGKDVLFNIYILVSLQAISLLISIFIIIPYMPYETDHSLSLTFILLTNLGVSSIFALTIIVFGLRKMNKIE